ncbi:MAG: RluA family pseudouridine synthase [Clostridiales bacterium]|nr:RluA family pseudouridine synthase [Clostridiales bacterium]
MNKLNISKGLSNTSMILYEDQEIVVCHKPAGVPVQSAAVREKDMVSILRNHIVSEHTVPGDIYVVHRLDQPVEGVLVFAKTKRAAADLGRQVSDGSMKKIYHAIVVVSPCAKRIGMEDMNEWYTLVDYLVKDGRKNHSFVSDANNKAAKRAELRFRILKRWTMEEGEYALAEIELKTGRHHQIRVQMAHAGLPLLGDRKYVPSENETNYSFSEVSIGDGNVDGSSGFVRNQARTGLALCAVSLTFRHPATGKTMRFEVEPQNEVLREFSQK